VKKWKKWQLEGLREAEKSAKTPLILIVGIEDGEAEFAIVRRYGVDFTARICHSISGKKVEKGRDESIARFNSEVAGKIDEVLKKEDISAVIICGPGFTKDNFFRYLKEKYQKIAGIAHMESAGAGGRAGVQEILKRGIVERVIKENRVSYEATLVEKLFIEISKGSGLAAYGVQEVERAISQGAVETLLISDLFLRTYMDIDVLIERTKKVRGKVVTISTEHEAGERLEGIGGIAALLRFTISGG
jgi:protein pelota